MSIALSDPHQQPPSSHTYAELSHAIQRFASGLQALGLARGNMVALFSENSSRWLVADQGVMLCGAADAVRGTSSTPEELGYIMEHSMSSVLIAQDAATLDRLLPQLAASLTQSPLRLVVVLWGQPSNAARTGLTSLQLLSYDEVMQVGQCAKGPARRALAWSDAVVWHLAWCM
jgi:long-chain acyl-CoA synthetase